MTNRHRAREAALQFLYQRDIGIAPGVEQPAFPQLQKDLQNHFDHFNVGTELREFAALLAAGTLSEIGNIDPLIEKHASHWKLSRMSLVDRNLLRMAVYEMLHFPDIPHSVTINEAIELAKQFGTAESSAFINGILDAIRQAHPKPDSAPETPPSQ